MEQAKTKEQVKGKPQKREVKAPKRRQGRRDRDKRRVQKL